METGQQIQPVHHPQRPKSIFDVTNENVIIVNKNVLMALEKITKLEQEVIALRLMIQAPEQPNARGEEGAESVSSEQ